MKPVGQFLGDMECDGSMGVSMAEWRRLAGYPPEGAAEMGGPSLDEILRRQSEREAMRKLTEGAAVPNCAGPSLEEIMERKAQEQRDQDQKRREFEKRLHAATVKMPPQRRHRSNVSADCPSVGECVLVRLPNGMMANGAQVGGVYQGIVESTDGNLVRVRIPDIENRVFVQSMSQLIREVVEAIPMDRLQETVPLHFQVGDRVRAVRDEGRAVSMVGACGIVERFGEGPVSGRPIVYVRVAKNSLERQLAADKVVEFYPTDLVLDVAVATADRQVHANEVPSFVGPIYIDPTTMPQETWAATLELAGGRVVEIPGPNPAIWEQVEERCWDAEEDVRVRLRVGSRMEEVELKYARPASDPNWGGGICFLDHDAARCWAHDMARVVNAASERGALLRSLRSYRRRPPVDPHADRAYPTLRAYLW